ncbi:MAG: hypothetical protein ACT4QC_02225 [Planctomycetaceae bacterium]
MKPLVLAVACVLAAGCGASVKQQCADVRGRVLRNGRPLENVRVTFIPEFPSPAGSPASWGVTDAAGAFRLTCIDGRPGAVLGTHRVVLEDVRGLAGVAAASREELDDKPPSPAAPRAATRVPATYTTAAASPLQRQVAAGTNEFDFDVGR